jgi:cell division protein FtsA
VEDVHTPRCTTAVGLVKYGHENRAQRIQNDSSMVGRMKMWMKKIM